MSSSLSEGNADRTGFLTDRKMHCAVNEATRIGFLRTLFEAAMRYILRRASFSCSGG